MVQRQFVYLSSRVFRSANKQHSKVLRLGAGPERGQPGCTIGSGLRNFRSQRQR